MSPHIGSSSPNKRTRDQQKVGWCADACEPSSWEPAKDARPESVKRKKRARSDLHEFDHEERRDFSDEEDLHAFKEGHNSSAGGLDEALQQLVTSTPETPAREAIPLSEEQREVVDLAVNGYNIFYTGAAGAGKSRVLSAIVQSLQDQDKNVHVTAPTGIAALNVGGTTIWTYIGLSPKVNKEYLSHSEAMARENSFKREAPQRMKDTEVLIIDEISMVDSNLFMRLNYVLKAARNNRKPFGGVQLICTGDFCQLPPVEPFENCVYCGFNIRNKGSKAYPRWICPHGGLHPKPHLKEWFRGDEWAFSSSAWKDANFVNVYLKKIHRQSDLRFQEMLNRCRVGEKLSEESIRWLTRPGHLKNPKYRSAVRILCRNEDVDRVNDDEFEKLETTDKHSYECGDAVEWKKGSDLGRLDMFTERVNDKDPQSPLKEFKGHRLADVLKLRTGTVVALVSNLDLQAGLCNGSQGVVVGFEPHDKDNVQRYINSLDSRRGERIDIWIFVRKPSGYPIVEFSAAHGRPAVKRTIYPDCFTTEKKDTGSLLVMSRTQIPLIQSWAMTIHRSQGMTLDYVRADLSRVFEKGQAYVALSRATTLQGLWLEGSRGQIQENLEKTGADPKVLQFLRDTKWYSGGPPEFSNGRDHSNTSK